MEPGYSGTMHLIAKTGVETRVLEHLHHFELPVFIIWAPILLGSQDCESSSDCVHLSHISTAPMPIDPSHFESMDLLLQRADKKSTRIVAVLSSCRYAVHPGMQINRVD